MDKLAYQEIIKRILREHAQYRSQGDDAVTSCDHTRLLQQLEKADHYFLGCSLLRV